MKKERVCQQFVFLTWITYKCGSQNGFFPSQKCHIFDCLLKWLSEKGKVRIKPRFMLVENEAWCVTYLGFSHNYLRFVFMPHRLKRAWAWVAVGLKGQKRPLFLRLHGTIVAKQGTYINIRLAVCVEWFRDFLSFYISIIFLLKTYVTKLHNYRALES